MLVGKFAKTMPQNPHGYIVRSKENNEEYVALYLQIAEHGIPELFKGRGYRCYQPGDGYKYGYMTDDITESIIINRAKVE